MTRGKLIRPGQQYGLLDADTMEMLKDAPDAAFLLMQYKMRHEGLRAEFNAADKKYAQLLSWDIKKVAAARKMLIGRGLVTVLHQGGNGAGDLGVYAFPLK